MSLYICQNPQCTTPRVNSNVNYGLSVKKMHIVMGDVDNEETMECGGMSVWKISVLFAQFCYDPKMTIKMKLSFKKQMSLPQVMYIVNT